MAKKKKSGKKQIVIVDDHPMMRQGLAQLINNEPDLEVACEADTAGEALELITDREPDLVLLDITLPDKNGLELIKDLQAQLPQVPLLAVSMHDEALYAERVLRAGGRGYIMKQAGGKKMLEAIRQVLNGQIFVSEKISAKILENFSGRRQDESSSPVEKLSDREFEVFQLIGQGKSTREIAEQLHLSVKTIEVHRAHIKEKLSLRHANELVRFAARWMEVEGRI